LPMYSSTEKLRTKGLNNRQLGKLTKTLVEQYIKLPIDELIPQSVLEAEGLIGIREAIRHIHFPASPSHLEQATRRLKYQELLAAQLKLHLLKLSNQKYAGWRFENIGA